MTASKRSNKWQKAASFAARLHAGQARRDGISPYAAHPFRVAMTVRQVFGIDDEIALAAAMLHDVIEDTTADYDEVFEQFGEEIAGAVAALTKDMRLPHDRRETDYDKQLAEASWQARAIKLADVYDNFCDSESDAARARAAFKARRAILCAGDDPRLATAVAAVRELVGVG